ncbi:riboflavin biosynthesis protein RibD [Azospirillum sp. TSH100]|uniref:RibD family protein n=1 Tax=Azospirillum sp. TSH100 TaxID=652764 RepID=UPI000D61581B|nr:dihydrofolate reductase family protein [Azospirillum sp. TSH100]PWC88397.1 riboflavin biosynthesis protein RibD [Azospirillum sp. TSH100]QCG90551.1 riboflavin biosynthesis protein RibD [Azospirillum sp. TSH100]
MTGRMLRLYPGTPEEVALLGAYLAHCLHERGSANAPFVYASFVSSLDGRIALRDPASDESRLPAGLVSGNDFRLFLELQAQADCLVTHGGYLRDLAAGRLDDVLQVGTQDVARELAQWRADNGLPSQPAIVIASASLDFPMPDSPASNGQRVVIATGAEAPADQVAYWRSAGYEVLVAGNGVSVDGGLLGRQLGGMGFRSIYLLTGPRMLDTMLRDGMLSRPYLTIAHRLLGGESFHSMLSGSELGDAGRLRLCALHYDCSAPDGTGQFFAHFEPQPAFAGYKPAQA